MIHPILFSLGAPEIILIVLVLLLLFGGKKIPELMRGIGQGMKEFKKAAKEEDKAPVSDDFKATNKDNI
jgi:sec-independent protein translocase protein TatA